MQKMTKMITGFLGLAMLSTMLGCGPYVVRKHEMDSQEKVKQLSKRLVSIYRNEEEKIKKVAIIGFSEVGNPATNSAMVLNNAYMYANKVLTDYGFEVVPYKEMAANPTYKLYGKDNDVEYFLTTPIRKAKKTRYSHFSVFNNYNIEEDIPRLIKALNVDAVIAVYFMTKGYDIVQNAELEVYCAENGKGYQNYTVTLRPGMGGSLKHDMEPWRFFNLGRTYKEETDNMTLTMNYSTELMVARMAMDLKKEE